MNYGTMTKTGIIGSVVAAICCATPVLVLLLGAAGLSAWVGWLDYVLLPAFVLFVGVTAYGVQQRRRGAGCCTTDSGAKKVQS